jgi:predicted permease
MKTLAYLRSLAAKFFHRPQVENEMDEELRSHIQHRAEDLGRSGLKHAEAERRARIEFGSREKFKEESREALGGNFIETLIQDLRFAFRTLRKSPSFTAVAVMTLALGIGANAVVFSVMNALILRPLNVPHTQSLYGIEHGESGFVSYPDYVDFRDRNHSFESLAAVNIAQAGLDLGQNPELQWFYEVSGNYFDALEIKPYLGRLLHSSDENGPNSAPYIVLSYSFWHVHFQDDRGVVGRTVQLNKHPFTIIGVTPPEFHGTFLFFSPDFFAPIVNHDQVQGENVLNSRVNHWVFEALGHLKAGVTPAQAVADLTSISANLEKAYPNEESHLNVALGRPSLYGSFLGGPIRAFVAGLMILAGLILLAACANLGSLFAARAADRSRELALRLALGASRGRILRQLFTEAVLIALIGGGVGLLGSIFLLGKLSVWQPLPRFPMSMPANPDAFVYVIAILMALLSGFLFGAAPVRQVLRTDPYEIVKSGATGKAGRRFTVRDGLLVTQIAICAVLVTSSMVAVRGLARSMHSNFGFEPRNAMLLNSVLEMGGYSGDKVPAMQRRMVDALETIPGVKSVGLIDYPPLAMGGTSTMVFAEDATDLRESNAKAHPYFFNISPGYFDAAGTAMLAGRPISWHDDKNAPYVAVVNREFAGRMFGSPTNALGKYFKRRTGPRIQVVGIVENGKYFKLTEDPKPAMFLSILQSPSGGTWLVVRSNRDPGQLSDAMRATIRNLDAGLPVYIQTWNNEMSGTMFAPRMATLSLGVLGGMGALLSMTGIFGMAAYSVSKRKRELGIRIALGAQRKEVLRAALGRSFKLLAFGSAVGMILGILASRVLGFIVYQATPRDPMVLTGVVLAMMLLGLIATWIPAQRALSIDALILMREE